MTPKDRDDKIKYEELLEEAKRLTYSTEVPPAADEFALEDILEEYGGGRQRQILREAEEAVRSEQQPEEPEQSVPPEPPEEPEKPAPPPRKPSAPKKPPERKSVEDVVGRTVEAVQEQRQEKASRPPKRRRTAKPRTETPPPGPKKEPKRKKPPETEEEPIGPEPSLSDAAAEARKNRKRRRSTVLPAAAVTAILAAVLAAEGEGIVLPLWTGDLRFQTLAQLGCLFLTSALCWDVFPWVFRLVVRRRWSGELIAVLAAAVSGADCASQLLFFGRT